MYSFVKNKQIICYLGEQSRSSVTWYLWLAQLAGRPFAEPVSWLLLIHQWPWHANIVFGYRAGAWSMPGDLALHVFQTGENLAKIIGFQEGPLHYSLHLCRIFRPALLCHTTVVQPHNYHKHWTLKLLTDSNQATWASGFLNKVTKWLYSQLPAAVDMSLFLLTASPL